MTNAHHNARAAIAIASGALFMFFAATASAASLLTASCTGTPSATAVTWAATSSGGIAPVSFLWSNGSTSTTQIVNAAPGTYTMTLMATDASSTVATTCSATILTPADSGSVAAQIQALLAQIAELKAKIAQLILSQGGGSSGTTGDTASSTPATCAFTHSMREGDDGGDVRDLQHILSGDPTTFSADFETGFFGPRTREALKHFQEKHGIPATGFFGPMSLAFVDSQCKTGDDDHDNIPNSLDDDDNNDGISDHEQVHVESQTSNGDVATTTQTHNDGQTSNDHHGEGQGKHND